MSVRMLSRPSSQPVGGGGGGGAVVLLSPPDDSPARENCSEDERIAKVPPAPYEGEDFSDGLAKQVVVVGVISRLEDEASQLLDRVLLAQVFAGRKCFAANPNARVGRKGLRGDWLDGKLKNYYDREKGMLYVQYVWGSSSQDCEMRAGESLAEALERHEGDSFRGLLFMFSVCHILLIVQEGSRFDPRYLRTFRTLQTAKHALAPFVKAQVLPGVLPQSSSRSSQSLRAGATSRDTVGRNGPGVSSGRQGSANGYVGGPAPVLYPGQCTPVALFVCLEECTESSSGCEDAMDGPGSSSSSPGSRLSKSHPGASRAGGKTEGGVRKKMQASTEAQIRFLLKKCRTLASVVGEGGSSGSAAAALRGLAGGVNTFGGAGNGGALFALDQSRAAVFIDRASNRQGAALEEISDVLANFLRNVEGPSTQTLNLAGLSEPVLDDVQVIKDFLLRHTDILRGRGGIASTATGSSGGAGMVAAAAAAAAASASGGAGGPTKPLHNPPDLPTVTAWFSASQILADSLTSAWESRDTVRSEPVIAEKNDNLKSQESSPRKSIRRYSQSSQGASPASGGISNSVSIASRQRVASLDGVISSLDSAIDIDHKFSKMWCKRSLPAAIEVYLKDLPSTYPTIVHNAHLQRALVVFHNMVRGPAVSSYVGKLTASCEAIWHAGRQLCDAVSLTGKPCRHLVHDVVNAATYSSLEAYDAGSVTESKVPKDMKGGGVCKPHSSGVMFLHACACGRSRKLRKDPFDYESANVAFFQFRNCEDLLPSLALPSTSSDNYFGGSAWSLIRLGSARYYQPSSGLMQIGFISNQKHLSLLDIMVLHESSSAPVSVPRNTDVAVEARKVAVEPTRSQNGSVDPKQQGVHVEQYSKVAEKGSFGENNRVAGRTSTSRMDKANVSTSSSSNANYGGDSAFPPLPQKAKKQLQSVAPSKASKPPNAMESRPDGARNDTAKNTAVEQDMASLKIDGDKEDKEPAPNPLFGDSGSSIQHLQVYVGFEHECPHGHRFLLSASQVQNLGLSYPQPGPGPEQDAVIRPDLRISEQPITSRGTVSDKKTIREGSDQVSRIIKGSGDGNLLLGMDLPIFMHCPHCEASAGREEKQEDMAYAGCVSQLQRIFLVTPSIPLLFTTQAVVQFEDHVSSLSKQQVDKTSAPARPLGYTQQQGDAKQERAMNVPGAPEVVLPPDSFLVLRLPFVYNTVEKNGNRRPLSYQKDAPERSAWLVKGTALRLLAKGSGAVDAVSWK